MRVTEFVAAGGSPHSRYAVLVPERAWAPKPRKNIAIPEHVFESDFSVTSICSLA